MTVEQVADKDELAQFFLKRPELHLYSLGDLDDFYWPYTTWYGRRGETGELAAVALIY